MSPAQRGARAQRGAVSLEAVLLVPLLVLVLGVMVGGWRLWSARSALTQASQAAARAATVQRSSVGASHAADQVLRENLRASGWSCDPLESHLDLADFSRPVGQSGQVGVEVTCRVGLDDLLAPVLPGAWTLRAEAHEPLDSYRERRP